MIQLNTFKTGGVIYKITEIEYVGKKSDFPKRELWVEVPTQYSTKQKSTIFKFEVVGEETGSLDWFNVGSWVDIVFKVDGREWTSPEGKNILFNSLKIIDIKAGDNPFKEGKQLEHTPDDLSNTLVSKTGDQVKDWINEKPKDDKPFDDPDEDTGLPF